MARMMVSLGSRKVEKVGNVPVNTEILVVERYGEDVRMLLRCEGHMYERIVTPAGWGQIAGEIRSPYYWEETT